MYSLFSVFNLITIDFTLIIMQFTGQDDIYVKFAFYFYFCKLLVYYRLSITTTCAFRLLYILAVCCDRLVVSGVVRLFVYITSWQYISNLAPWKPCKTRLKKQMCIGQSKHLSQMFNSFITQISTHWAY